MRWARPASRPATCAEDIKERNTAQQRSSGGVPFAYTAPAHTATGKVHGDLPSPADLKKYDREELDVLKGDLEKSVQQRIKKTDELGRDKAHGQRQGAEQDLIKSIDKHLEDN